MARRGENIRKRKDGRWEGRYIKARTSEGKIQWGYVYGTVYAEVKRVLIQKKAEVGFYNLKKSDLTFEALAEVWLHSIKNGIKESTYAHYSYTLHKYLLPVLSKMPVVSFEESFLEQAMQQIITPIDSAHKPLGNSSARECLSMLRRICKYAAHLRLIRPMELEVALPKAIDKISAPLSPAERQRLYQYVQENPTTRKIGLLLGLELGLRIGEICGLQWGDFDLKLGMLKINRTVCRISCGNGHTKVVIQTPKTRTSRREIPIPKQLLIVLKKLRRNASNSTWFLSGSESKPTEPRCYRKSIKVYLKQATVRQVRPHALRHTFATTCLQAGCDVKTLSELLGHANANITLQRYEIISGHRRQHAAQLAGLDTLPVIVRQMDDDAAVLLMVDSNLQRENILPSERAFAYKMKLEALKNQGARSDLTSRQVGEKLWSVSQVSADANESERQVHRFIRLTNLIPELLDMVDEKKIAFNPAVELSYLDEAQQRDFLEAMSDTQNAPSLSQAQRLKRLAQEGHFSYDVAFAVMGEEKKDELDKVVIKNDTLRKYFPRSYTPKQMEDTIIKLLEQWQRKQQRQNER